MTTELVAIAVAISSAGGEMPEIETLARRVQTLGASVDFWNQFMMWGLAAAAIAATWVVVATRLTIVRSRELATAQISLDSAKDRKAAADSKAKDVKIAEATEAAGHANERAASLELEAQKLRGQVLSQGPRANSLVGANRKKLIDALIPYKGQLVDVRHSAFAIMVNSSVVSSTPIGDDALGLANALIPILKESGWSTPDNALLGNLTGRGIQVDISMNASAETRNAAQAIVEALRSIKLETFGVYPAAQDRFKRVGSEVFHPPLSDNTIVITVLTHE
jgi:hypothetical protein